MPANKLDMSLDDIIKANKQKEQGRKANTRKNQGKQNTNLRKRSGGVAKKAANQQRKPAVARRNRAANRPLGKKNGPTQKTPAVNATKKLVNKLVKKALAQTSVARRRAQPVVRNVIRRGGAARLPRRNAVLNRISNKSRIIRRAPTIPTVAPVVNIPRNRIRFPAAAAVRRVGGARRSFRRVPQQQQQVVRRAVPVVPQNSIRGQISALRRQTQPVQQRVVYAQPRRQQVIRQQRTVYVQAQPRQQFVVQQPRRQVIRQQKTVYRNVRHNNNSGAFFDPPNFLQRVPTQAQVRRVRY